MENNEHQEVERKWLISNVPKELLLKPLKYFQAYLVITNSEEVRIRKITSEDKVSKYKLSYKSGTGLNREEVETSLNEHQFKKLLPAAKGRIIEKTRFIINDSTLVPELLVGGKLFKIELDIYSGKHEGLITAEVEFYDEAEANKFIPPNWFGKEVTFVEKYKNKNLALYNTFH